MGFSDPQLKTVRGFQTFSKNYGDLGESVQIIENCYLDPWYEESDFHIFRHTKTFDKQ